MQVEFDELHMSFPALVPKAVVIGSIAAEVDMEPIYFVAPLASGTDVLESEKAAADMVEHAVEHDADAAFLKFFDQTFKIGVVAQPPVHVEKINRVVAVPFAFKQRIEQYGVKAHLFYIRDLLFDDMQPMAHRSEIVFPLRTAIAERINLIKSTFVKPHMLFPALFESCAATFLLLYYYTTAKEMRQQTAILVCNMP